MTGTDRRWVIGGLVAAVVAVVGLAGQRWGPSMIDLEVYRIGARAVLDGTDIYTVAEPRTGLVFTYPVFAALVFVPITVVPLIVARVVLTLVSLAALFVVMHITVTQVRGTPSLPWSIALSAVAVAAHPVWETFTFGQVNLILAALVLLDVFVLRRWRGSLVGIATGIKLVPGLFILWYLVTGQRRAALNAALATLVTVAVGFAVQPAPAWAYWTHHALNPERTGGVAYVANQSILGVCARLLRDPHPPRVLTLTLSAVVVVLGLLLAWRLYRLGDTFLSLTVVAVAGLLASPISWSHHWVWAIPCLGTLVIWARGSRRRWWVFGVVTAIVVAGPMQWMPKMGLRELHHTHPQQLVANIYVLLGVAYLIWAAVRVRRSPGATLTASPGSAPTS